MKRVSIKDIAAKAGVVPSTVSLVLNGKARQMRISADLEERIKKIADEEGYTPNQTAVSLRTGRSKLLGLIVEDISNVFFATLAKVIEDKANERGFKILYCSTDNDDEKGNDLLRVLLNRGVDGFLITPSSGMQKEVSRLITQKKPVVLMDRYFPDIAASYVLVDNYAGVRDGVKHLLDKGYRDIGFITNNLGQVQMQMREKAYRDTVGDYNSVALEESILRLPYHVPTADGVALISEYLQANKQLDAVFFATNYLGLYGLESVAQLGLSVPKQLAIVCFDDHDIFRLVVPGITCVRQPIEEIASTAVDLLIRQLEGDTMVGSELHEFKLPSLIIRNST
ncbi:MAG: LacI family transcriptional regulator [Chitinophagaceae bacterium]|nr:MAG: LacI family transcriptional regulator [Chitinophagaceae bacterium]